MTNFEFAKKLVGDMAICVDSCARKAVVSFGRRILKPMGVEPRTRRR